MKFIVDECTGPTVAKWLKERFEVFSVYDESPGIDDESIINKAYEENYVLITNDKDFGELVFRRRKSHNGVLLLRLDDESVNNKIKILGMVLDSYLDRLIGNFIVATEKNVRIVERN